MEAAPRPLVRRISSPASTSATSTTHSTPGGGTRPAPRRAVARAASSRAGARRVGLPRVYDVGRLARLRRRQGRGARPRSAIADGLPPREDEGWRRSRVGRPPRRPDPRELGADGILMMDANQVWGVDEAIAAMRIALRSDPWWIEEPTSPDDVLGSRPDPAGDRARPGRDGRARPEPRHLQAAVPGRGDRLLPARRLPGRRRERGDRDHADGGEVRDPGVPPRGRCRACASTSSISRSSTTWRSAASLEDRVVEWVDHLHEHFVDPAVVATAVIAVPTAPGYSIEMLPESLDEYAYPDGPAWSRREALVE